MKVAITGGMGCGKTTVLHLFETLGAKTLDSDVVVRQLLEEDAEVCRLLGERFGEGVLDRSGKIDRAALAATVFPDSEKIACLESILHPRVREIWICFQNGNDTLTVVEVPLLFETGMQGDFDAVVCLTSSNSAQMRRLRARGLSDEQIKWRLQRQWPLVRKMRNSDIVLFNYGTTGHLCDQIKLLVERWRTQKQFTSK